MAPDFGSSPDSPHSLDYSADEAALAEASAELDAVEAALSRLEDGSFERCEVCGDRVGPERLRADPLLTRCGRHAQTGEYDEGSGPATVEDRPGDTAGDDTGDPV